MSGPNKRSGCITGLVTAFSRPEASAQPIPGGPPPSGPALQPIPFADFFVLTPLQAYAGTRIAAIRGVNIGADGAGKVIREILGAIGMGLLGQQMVIGAYKTFIPFLGAITTIPLVYGATTAICYVMDAYFKAEAKGARMTPDEMKRIWQSAREQGEREGRPCSGGWNEPLCSLRLQLP